MSVLGPHVHGVISDPDEQIVNGSTCGRGDAQHSICVCCRIMSAIGCISGFDMIICRAQY